MSSETERKFLVRGDFRDTAVSSEMIIQGYLCDQGNVTVRVRITANKAWLNIKGAPEEGHFTRYEWEKEIDTAEARELLKLNAGALIEKTRFRVPFSGHLFEVDVFHSDNDGLVIAEVELQSEDELFEKPSWLGEEVTSDKRYYNAALVKYPYCRWRER